MKNQGKRPDRKWNPSYDSWRIFCPKPVNQQGRVEFEQFNRFQQSERKNIIIMEVEYFLLIAK